MEKHVGDPLKPLYGPHTNEEHTTIVASELETEEPKFVHFSALLYKKTGVIMGKTALKTFAKA